MWTDLSKIMYVHLPACPSPLRYIQQPKKPMHRWHISAIWRAGAAGVCRRLGSKVAPGETTAVVGNGRAASDMQHSKTQLQT